MQSENGSTDWGNLPPLEKDKDLINYWRDEYNHLILIVLLNITYQPLVAIITS